jgi:DNA adenine methylase
MWPHIRPHMPLHETYVEPYAGSLAIFMQKPPAEIEVINDLDGDVINFFDQLRSNTDALIHAIQCTPYARAELRRADDQLATTADPLERARLFYVLCAQGWASKKHAGRRSWRYQTKNNGGKQVVSDWNDTDHLWAVAWRIQQAFIESDNALAIIDRYDGPRALFYIDPPYVTDSRRRPDHGYDHEMTDADHAALLTRLRALQGNAIISGYPHPLYDDALADWQRVAVQARTTNPEHQATEVLWISPNAVRQPTLF